ncbi:MAG: N-acetylneuraminate synthase family protein [Burkholderiales bacterium]|nr:N-acetylneuraminate synthase family protein [Phycisphaerae bacterium]
MTIGGREIGAERPVLVIAEIGVNHDGSVETALALVAAAAKAGADAVKLQVFTAERLLHPSARFANYQSDRTTAVDPAAMLRRYELADEALSVIVAAIRDAGLIPIATPFSPADVDRVVAIGAAAIKIASPDLVNKVLLGRACATRLPMILSTGAAARAEIDAAVEWLRLRAANLSLLHCVSSYPTSPAETNLRWIVDLARFGLPVGYSDHSTELIAGALAIASGASIIEKHLTYDTSAAGPDHSASFDPGQFAEYVKLIRLAEQMRGSATRHVLDCENDVRSVSHQSLVAARTIDKGTAITHADLTCQRPGDGISAWELDAIVGRRAAVRIEAGALLSQAALSPAMLDSSSEAGNAR